MKARKRKTRKKQQEWMLAIRGINVRFSSIYNEWAREEGRV